MSADGERAPGSITEEASALFQALQDWVRPSGSGEPEQSVPDGAECRMCPFCQLLRLLRGARPDAFEHLSDASASLAAAVRELIVAHERDWSSRASHATEHIDIG